MLVRTLRRAAFLLVLLAGLGYARAAAAQEWFDSYERGVQALRLGRGAAAALLLERSARMRPEPGTKVLTYGTHRIERYHPYLRLAEAYLMVGNAVAARDALRRSEQRAKEPAAERDEIAVRIAALEAASSTPTAATPTPRASEPAPPSAAPLLVATPVPLPAATAATAPPPTPSTREPAASPRASPEARSAPATVNPRASVAPAAPEPAASLTVYSQPAGVSIYLDDELLGSTDPRSGRLVKSQVAPGKHRVRWQRDGFAGVEKTVELSAGEPAVLRADLAAQPADSGLVALLSVAAVVALAGLAWIMKRARRATSRLEVLETLTRTGGLGPPVSPSSSVDPFEGETRAVPAGTTPGGQGELFGPFRLAAPLGKGGMAAVFKAERNGDVVALKRPLSGFLEDPEFLERFLREAEIGRTLHHPNIIRIFERGNVAAVPYFTMELVAGETLQERLKRSGAFEPRLAASVVSQVAEALDYAHLKGVVHRDLKPSNIMLLEAGAAKVMDYGIARARQFDGLTVTGAFLGTPDYVAPETAEGKDADARSDLYSLGVVFYELLTGQKPFVGKTPFETLKKHCSDPPTPPSAIAPGVPRELEVIILKLLNKRPEDRYPGAEALLIDLRAYLNRAR